MGFKKPLLFLVVTLSTASLYFLLHSQWKVNDFGAASAAGPWTFQGGPKDLNLMYLGYTRCPDLCPMTLSLVKQAFKKLKPQELDKIRFLFVDLDVENDNAQIAENYANQFDPRFIGLSGTPKEINAVAGAMGATFNVEIDQTTHKSYAISHPNRIYFLNRKGRILDFLANPDSPDTILKMIRENL